jgi:hypothetical protein
MNENELQSGIFIFTMFFMVNTRFIFSVFPLTNLRIQEPRLGLVLRFILLYLGSKLKTIFAQKNTLWPVLSKGSPSR